MKKIKKSLIGIAICIALFDLINIFFYKLSNTYVSVENVIYCYIIVGIFGIIIPNITYVLSKLKKTKMNEYKKVINYIGIALGLALLFNIMLLMFNYTENDIEGIVIIVEFLIIIACNSIIEIIKFCTDKENIKKINKQLKERNNK